MGFSAFPASQERRRYVRRLVQQLMTAFALLAPPVSPAIRAEAATVETTRTIITNDTGGSVAERVRTIRKMRHEGQGVAIPRGRCLSACTLYLGLPNTCVGRRARFGFHGPSSATPGIGLPRAEFERWSRIMAEHYPTPIRRWFLQTARHRTIGVYMVSGAELIRLGVPECRPEAGPEQP
ncbi:MAG: hypothetical protein R3E44_14525 [Paracoccaceae bacterium]